MAYYKTFPYNYPLITEEEFFYLMFEYLHSNPESVVHMSSFFELMSAFFKYRRENTGVSIFKTEDFFEYFKLGDNNESN